MKQVNCFCFTWTSKLTAGKSGWPVLAIWNWKLKHLQGEKSKRKPTSTDPTYGSWHWNLVTPANIRLLSWTGQGKTAVWVWVRCQRTLQQAQIFTGSSWGCTLVSIFKPWMKKKKNKKIQASMSKKVWFTHCLDPRTIFLWSECWKKCKPKIYLYIRSTDRLDNVPFEPFSKHRYN